jgi:CRISPR-associated protein Cas2
MTVFVLERVPVGLRGVLTRWLLEVSAGVFVGSITALVRDLLWEKVTENSKGGRCVLLHRTNNEQGFAIRMHGHEERQIVDMDGLQLIALKNAAWEAHAKKLAETKARRAARQAEQAQTLEPPPSQDSSFEP